MKILICRNDLAKIFFCLILPSKEPFGKQMYKELDFVIGRVGFKELVSLALYEKSIYLPFSGKVFEHLNKPI